MNTIGSFLDAGGDKAPALLSVDGGVLDRATLRREVDRLATRLRSFGIRPRDRLAIVLPNGPEMALTFLAVTAVACAAPLNPGYREEEFRFYFDDLEPKALITLSGGAPAAHAALPDSIMTIAVEGDFTSLGFVADTSARPADGQPDSDDVALILHTSGTTSRPKMVPLRQRNLARSARNIAGSLALGESDHSLNVMPLFHIHGLMAGLLAPLSAGGSVSCTPGFDAFRFPRLAEKPTTDLLHGSPDHAPDGACTRRRTPDHDASIRAVFIGFSAGACSGGDPKTLRCPGDRSLWDDRSYPPDGR